MKTRLLQSLYMILGVLGFIFIPYYLGKFVSFLTYKEAITDMFTYWLIGMMTIIILIISLVVLGQLYAWFLWVRTGKYHDPFDPF